MEVLLAVLLILGALLAGAASPGPSFVLIARMALGVSRRDAIAASFGMGLGGAIFATLALLGLNAILHSVPTMYMAFKVLGGLYLVYMAVRIWRTAKEPLAPVKAEQQQTHQSFYKSFSIGLLTQLSNPKTAIVHASIFAALLPSGLPAIIYWILPLLVFVIEAAWYSLVVLTLSMPSPRAIYRRSKAKFDYLAASVMGALGLKLVYSANE